MLFSTYVIADIHIYHKLNEICFSFLFSETKRFELVTTADNRGRVLAPRQNLTAQLNHRQFNMTATPISQ